MNKLEHPLLNLAAMEALRRVRLHPRGAAEGTFAGPHRSPYRGTAVEFADYREYTDGDDIRLVDWKVFARTDRHYVRLYDAERNLLTCMVVDNSGSMEYSGTVHKTESKLQYAARLAAAFGYLVVREGDEVGLSMAGEHVGQFLPPGASWPHLNRILDVLAGAKAEGRTDLGACLREAHARSKRRGILVVLSDFLDADPGFWTSIDLFRRSRFDVILFQVAHPEEIDLPEVAAARFVQTEGLPGHFNAEPDAIRALYHERFALFLSEMKAGCQARGCDWHLATTTEDPCALLRRCFARREAAK